MAVWQEGSTHTLVEYLLSQHIEQHSTALLLHAYSVLHKMWLPIKLSLQ